MALTPTEEAQTRQLIAQEAPLLSLASNEPTITSKLGATKVNLSQLPAASTIADADILLIRQGTVDKSVAASVFKTYASPAASETVVGVVRLATDAETATGTSRTIAVDPAGAKATFAQLAGLSTQLFNVAAGTSSNNAVNLGQFSSSLLTNGYQKLAGGLIIQWGITSPISSGTSANIAFPIAFPTAGLQIVAGVGASGLLSNNFTGAMEIQSRTNFNVYSYVNGGGAGTYRWIAVGY